MTSSRRTYRRPNIVRTASTRPTWSTCWHCGKRTYVSRKDAKRMARETNSGPMSTYRCESDSGWHVGHVARIVHRGEVTRAEWYGHPPTAAAA